MKQIPRRPALVLVLAIFFIAGALAGISARPQSATSATETPTPDESLHILVVNDDGIDAPGLHTLARELATLGEVVVCAPDGNRSGVSHSFTLFRGPFTAEAREIAGASEAWAVSGTPADAVAFGLVYLGRDDPFDLVVSGINAGSNVGNVAHISGTVGAAMEGAFHGVQSIAVSQGDRGGSYELAASFTADFVRTLGDQGFTPGIVYSINVPSPDPEKIVGVVAARMGGSYFKVDEIVGEEPEGDVSIFRARAARGDPPPADSDTDMYTKGYITIAPLRFDWTDAETLARMKMWDLSLPANSGDSG